MYILNPGCDKTKFKFRSNLAKIKGVVYKIRFQTGIRYGIDCGMILLFLNIINEDSALDVETKCED